MKYLFVQAAFGLGANALVARNSAQQCIQLKSSGGASGVLGQLSDGQNRVGGGHPTGCYCMSNGGFTDSNGRGCILTSPTTQFQCDAGASPTSGFSLGSDGKVNYNGSGKFYACPVNENGEWNVYSQPVKDQTKCVEISLSSAGSCGSGAQSSMPASYSPAQSQPAYSASMPAPQSSKEAPKPSAPAPQSSKAAPKPSAPAPQSSKEAPKPSAPAPSPPARSQPAYSASMPAPQSSNQVPKPSAPAPQSSKPAPKPSAPAPKPSSSAPQPSTPSNACPTDLNGAYQYPHLIIPIDSQSPTTAHGTSYFGTLNSHTCTIFNFDIPASYASKTCTLLFLFPEQKDLTTSSYNVSGSGMCSFSKLKGPASQQTTWANQPGKETQLGSWNVQPGGSYSVASGECAAGQTVSYEVCSAGDFSLEYFQDWNPSPIGLFIRQC
jgi:hypothetical protein